jgi:filamentous hemagglutinin family protein
MRSIGKHPTIPFRLRPLAALIAAAAAGTLFANPQGGQVVSGQASFAQNGKTLTVTNTPGAIINWQQFNINRGELTRFVQQSAASQVLNRVTGVDPSAILGSLQSNGRVFLVNPNGIVFGAGSQVDVAGLVASTLRLSDADFQANRLRFTDSPGAGDVRNAGSLRSATGGEILLVAPRVENSGLIQAPGGVILLAAGRSVEVADIDRPNIRVEVTNTDEEAVNLGTLLARNISIYGGLVRNSGHIQASSAIIGENGKVTLKAAQRVVLEPTSVIEASGSQGTTGGEIAITAQNKLGLAGGGEVQVQGLLSARPLIDAVAQNYVPNVPVARVVNAQAAIKTGALSPSVASGSDAAGAPSFPAATVADAWPTAVTGSVLSTTSTAQAAVVTQGAPGPFPAPSPARPNPAVPAVPVNPAGGGTGGYGTGGSVRISAGGRVSVGDGAHIDASGVYGGGEILVGGGWQGLNPNIINSQFTYIAATATLTANAGQRGKGGTVVAWSDDTSTVLGKLSARGGIQGGDGGAIETSGATRK